MQNYEHLVNQNSSCNSVSNSSQPAFYSHRNPPPFSQACAMQNQQNAEEEESWAFYSFDEEFLSLQMMPEDSSWRTKDEVFQ